MLISLLDLEFFFECVLSAKVGIGIANGDSTAIKCEGIERSHPEFRGNANFVLHFSAASQYIHRSPSCNSMYAIPHPPRYSYARNGSVENFYHEWFGGTGGAEKGST